MSALTRRAVVAFAIALVGLATVALPARAATGWRIDYTPSQQWNFTDVAATGPTDAWAVGSGSCCDNDSRRISHWNGSQWQDVAPPAAPSGISDTTFKFVGASSAQDIWALGYGSGGDSFAQHWNGTSWKDVLFPPAVHLEDIADIGPNDTWIVGSDDAHATPYAAHFDGTQLTRVTLPSTIDNLTSVSATSGSNVWFAGAANDGTYIALQWNGTAWKTETLPITPPRFYWVLMTDIVAVGTNDVWASGFLTNGNGAEPNMILVHREASGWSPVSLDAPNASIDHIAPDGANGLWLVSRYIPPSAELLHYSGGTLTRENAPVQPGTTADIYDLTLIPETRSLLAPGVLFQGSDVKAAMFRYDP